MAVLRVRDVRELHPRLRARVLEALGRKPPANARGSPSHEDLFLRQARELDRKQREAILHQLQKQVAERVLTAPIFQQAFLCGVGSRVEEAGAGLIQGFPYSAPGEDLKVKP